jgi:hypothetical protein
MFAAHKITMLFVLAAFSIAPAAHAQDQQPMKMDMPMESAGWNFMQDGVVFGLFNHQGGPRGGDEFRVPNWWMGMTSRKFGSSQFTFNTMLSLDAATVGKKGYREIFQSGEVVDGRPLIDRQHPHDLFMQIAGIWRVPISSSTGFTIAGGPTGEPAIGPVAFMHRASAAENPFAPLSHHVFDSTHIAFGVVTAAVDHGPWVLEASLFNGREPDENRWNFDFGKLDSVAGRIWYKPNDQWEFQLSSASLKEPEALEHGDITRTTASGAWFKKTGENFTAVTAAYGQNNKAHGIQHSFLAEGTRRVGRNSLFGRLEVHQVETATLALGLTPDQLASAVTLPPACPSLVHCVGGLSSEDLSRVLALTLGGVHDVLRWRGFEGGIGAALTFYGVPEALKPTHGDHPVSFQVFFRLRPPAPMGRMWNMRMSQPMSMSHEMQMKPAADPHAGHHMN